MAPRFFEAAGASVKFNVAIETKRSIWVSDDFCREHGTLMEILQTQCAKQNSKWKWLDTRASFLELHEKNNRGPKARRRPLDAIALVTLHEQRQETGG